MPEEQHNPYATPVAELVDTNTAAEDDNLASRWARLGAALLDTLIISVVTLPAVWYFVWRDIELAQWEPSMTYFLGAPVAGFLVWLLIQGYFLSNYAQTLGKRIVGIQMVYVDSGQPASFADLVLKRYLPVQLVAAIPHIGGLFNIVDVLFIFRADKRCVHDLIAGTKVIKLDS